jgi:hypothetical protein
MLEFAAPLQRLAVSRTLWLIVAWPLLGLVWQLLVVRPRIERSRDTTALLRELPRARVAGAGTVALAATATAGHAALLARMPSGGRALLQPVLRGPRFGGLDAGVDLLLDERGLAACLLTCGVAVAAAFVLARQPASERGWRPWAWLQLALAAALVSFLADGFVAAAMGWSLAAVAGAWLAGWHDDDGAAMLVATRSAAGVGAMLAGGALLFWGTTGTWDDAGYVPDGAPPFAAVRAGVGAGGPSLTMTSVPGAHVFVDDPPAAELRAPFVRVPLAVGSHTVRVHLDDGDTVLAHIDAAPGEELAIVSLGPSLSFHTLADAIALRSRDEAMGWGVAGRVAPGGVPVLEGALLALLAAAGAMAPRLRAAPPGPLGAFAAGVTSAIGPFLLVRFEFLFQETQARTAVAALGVVVFLGTLWQAVGYVGARRWLVFAGGAAPALSLVALGLGGAAPGVPVLVASGAAASAVYLLYAGRSRDAVVPGAPGRGAEGALLVRIPAELGDLLASMERWVIGAAAGAFGVMATASAWLVAMVDEHIISSPAEFAALRVRRAAAAVQPLCGLSVARLVWALLALTAAAAVFHALWSGG